MKASKAGCRRNRNASKNTPINPFGTPATQAEARSILSFLKARVHPGMDTKKERAYKREMRVILNNICALPEC